MLEYVPLLESPLIIRIYRSIRKNIGHLFFLCLRYYWIIAFGPFIAVVIAYFVSRKPTPYKLKTINYNLSYVKGSSTQNPESLKEWTIFIREMTNHLAQTPVYVYRHPVVNQFTTGYAYSFQLFFSSDSSRFLDSVASYRISLIEARAKALLPADIQLNRLSEDTRSPAKKRSILLGAALLAGFVFSFFTIIMLDALGLSYRGLKKTKERFLGVISRYNTEKVENLTALMHSLNYEIDQQKNTFVLFVGGYSSMDFIDTMGIMYAAYTDVAVINFDLYRDNSSDTPGLTNYLYGECTMEEAIQKTPEGYYSVGSGIVPEENAYLLLLREWKKVELLINELRRFSVVLIKTPYLKHSPVVLKLLDLQPLTIMVAEPTMNNQFFMQLHKQLKENKANIAGFVINNVSSSDVSPNFWD